MRWYIEFILPITAHFKKILLLSTIANLGSIYKVRSHPKQYQFRKYKEIAFKVIHRVDTMLGKQEFKTQVHEGDNSLSDNDVLTTVISPSGKEIYVKDGDTDMAMNLAMQLDDTELSPEDDRKLFWKSTLYILPLICLLYAVQMMDKITNSGASIMGIRTDLNMVGNQYSWTGSAFYFGYLFFEFPAVYIIQRFPLAKVGAIFFFLWGVVLCLCATTNYAGFLFLRIVLGMLESSVTPILVILTGQWYKSSEQFMISAIWFSFCGVGVVFGGSISLGIFIRQDQYGIEGWKMLFIITGAITVFLSFVFYFWIPNTPAEAWFLTEQEKLNAIKRIKGNQQGFGNKHFKKKQFIEAFTDHRTYLYFLYGIAVSIPNGGLTTFGGIVMTSILGYSVEQSMKYNIYQGLIEVGGCILLASCIKFVKHRMIICIIGTSLSLVFSCMLAFATDPKVRLAGCLALGLSIIGTFTMLSNFSSNVAGHTKKVTVNALFLVGFGAGNIIGPQTFLDSQAPTYVGGQLGMVVNYAACLIISILLYLSYIFENRKRDRMVENGEIEPVHTVANVAFADLTDKENPYFRYAL